MTRRLRTPLVVLVVGITLAGAACGGDDDDSSDAQGASSETSIAAAVTTAAAGAETTAPTASETTAESTEPTASDRLYGDAGTATTAADADADVGAASVEVVDSSLGKIVASGGVTLYAFLPDNAGAPTCAGDCAAAWPPLEAADDLTFGDGLEAEDFSTASRSDGGEQVTFYGWPLYFYSGDKAPGDVNGQGLGNSWYVVAPDGTMISD